MSGGCGLSTFLMLINPEKNLQVRKFLNDFYQNIKFLKKKQIDEFKWAVVVDYLILKSVFNPDLKNFIYSKDPDIVEYYFPIKLYELKNYWFANYGLISKTLFNYHLHKWKTNNDLKMLFYLFGGTYYPQPQQFPDGTGSLYFDKDDTELKKNRLIEHLKKSNRNETSCIALNIRSFHWVAVNSVIDNNTLLINNPSGGQNTLRFDQLDSQYRFYLFSYDLRDSIILNSNVIDPFDYGLEEYISDSRLGHL